MDTRVCTLTGSAHYNYGWVPTSGYRAVGSEAEVAGGDKFCVMRFAIPATQGDFTSVSFTVSINGVAYENASSNLSWGISTIGRDAARPPTMIWSGVWQIRGLTKQNQKFTTTTGTINLTSDTSIPAGTVYYLWFWGSNRMQMYKANPASDYYSVVMNYQAVTPCTAPTTVTSPSRVGRGKSISVSWSGAKSGVSNPIFGYNVYWRAGSQPTKTNYDGVGWAASDRGSGSYTITQNLSISENILYYIRIEAAGRGGVDFRSPLSSSATTRINTTPVINSFTVDTPIVSSSGSKTVKFNFSTYDANGDAVTVRIFGFASGPEIITLGTSSPGATSLTLTLGSNVLPDNDSTTGQDKQYTFEAHAFDSYDGVGSLFHGNAQLKITRKAKPIVTGLTISAGNSPSYRTTSDNNTLPFTTLVTASAQRVGAVSTHNWYLRSSSTLAGLSSASSSTIATTSSISNVNISGFVGFGRYYQIGYRFNSGYENSDTVWKTTSYSSGGRTSTAFYMAPRVEIINRSNRHSTVTSFNPTLSTYTGAQSTDFSTEVCLALTYNSLYTTTFWWRIGSGNRTQIGSSAQGIYGRNLSFTNAVTSRTTYTLEVRTQYGSATASYSSAVTMTKIISNPLSSANFKSGVSGTIQPIYTNYNSLYTPTFSQFWGSNNLSTYYAIPSNFSTFSLWVHVGSSSKRIFLGSENPPDSTGQGTGSWPFRGYEFYNWTANVLNLTFNQNYTAYLQLRVTDYFGNSFTSNSASFTFSTRESPVYEGSVDLSITYNRGDTDVVISPSGSTIINQGYNLKFNIPTAKTWNNTRLSYDLQVCRSKTPLANITQGTYENYVHYPATELQNSTIVFNHWVGTVTDSNYYYFRVIVKDPLNQQVIQYYTGYTLITGKLQEISPSNLVISNGELNEDQTQVSFNYLLSDAGGGVINDSSSFINLDDGDGLIQVRVQYSTDGENYINISPDIIQATSHSEMSLAISSSLRPLSLTVPKVTTSFIYVRLRVKTRVYNKSGSFTPEYITYSNVIAIPSIQPTIAYRKGHLGINNQNFDTEDLLVVNVSRGTTDDGRHLIRLTSGNWEGEINLITGEINNFIIDGGSWDNKI